MVEGVRIEVELGRALLERGDDQPGPRLLDKPERCAAAGLLLLVWREDAAGSLAGRHSSARPVRRVPV